MSGKWTRAAVDHMYHWAPFAVLAICLAAALVLPPTVGVASSEEGAPTAGEWLLNNKVLAYTYYYIMGAAHVYGSNNTDWRTSVEVCNFGNSSASYELHYLVYNQNNSSPAVQYYSLSASQCRRFDDVLANQFSVSSGKGTIRVSADEYANVFAVGRTYNQTSNGTYGQFMVGNSVAAAVRNGEVGYLTHLTQATSTSSGYRTNLGLQNVTGNTVAVQVQGYMAGGTYLGSFTQSLLPYEYDQVVNVFGQFTSSGVTDGFLVLTTSTGGGAFMADASVVDNRTGDGVTVPMQKRR